MSDQIQAGDLVYVYKSAPCCNNREANGAVFTVGHVLSITGRCKHCGFEIIEAGALSATGTYHVRLGRLKKIPPLSELEKVEAMETMTA